MSMFVIANFALFQALWFSSVVGAGGYDMHWLAIGAIIPLTLLTWFSPVRRLDFAVATVMLCVGLLLDNIWVQMGILAYPGASFAPYWIGLLWVGLGMTLNHSMAFFRDRGLLGALIVGAFAPVTYLTGQKFGAVHHCRPVVYGLDLAELVRPVLLRIALRTSCDERRRYAGCEIPLLTSCQWRRHD